MEAANAVFLQAYNTQNGEAFQALYTKDATLLPPGSHPANGSEAIAQYWSDRIKGGHRKNLSFQIISIQSDTKYVSQVAGFTVDVVNDSGETKKQSGNSVRVFEKQPDGKWLTKAHIFNAY